MRLPIIETVQEALGFGAKGFDTVARLAWLPLLLAMLFTFAVPYLLISIIANEPVSLSQIPSYIVWPLLWQNMGSVFEQNPDALFAVGGILFVLLAILYSSFYVPLQRYAATGERPHTASFDVPFSIRHLQVIGAMLAGGYGLYVATQVPFFYAMTGLAAMATQTIEQMNVSFPDPDSLHTVVFAAPDEIVKHSFPKYLIIGLNWVILPITLYMAIRLFMWPAFIAAKDPGEKAHSFARAWNISKGWNGLRMLLAAFILYGLLWVLGTLLNGDIVAFAYGLVQQERPGLPFKNFADMFNIATMSLAQFMNTMFGIGDVPLFETASFQVLIWARMLLFLFVNLGLMILSIGIWTGFAGSIYRRYIVDASVLEMADKPPLKVEAKTYQHAALASAVVGTTMLAEPAPDQTDETQIGLAVAEIQHPIIPRL